jgi:hypothetical protein
MTGLGKQIASKICVPFRRSRRNFWQTPTAGSPPAGFKPFSVLSSKQDPFGVPGTCSVRNLGGKSDFAASSSDKRSHLCARLYRPQYDERVAKNAFARGPVFFKSETLTGSFSEDYRGAGGTQSRRRAPELIVLHTYNQYASWTVALIRHFVPIATH